ncbi:hypothetical protein TPE_0023 [Treponema pedis str. T A4]|uniref:Uncharacterized protein n=1 Tax=Treponema pedis str. T A4 TaxID=1291379 RepID=S6A2B6_9SPIR|nr:hypothetical protein TPE_0023 [Treponema pedis str. T A4]
MRLTQFGCTVSISQFIKDVNSFKKEYQDTVKNTLTKNIK